MKTFKHTWILVAVVLVLASCKRESPFKNDQKDDTPSGDVNIAAKDLVVPANFDFNTSKELTVKVKIAEPIANQRYVIKIYNDVPSTGALITTGLTDANAEYTTKLTVPAWEDFIYIEKISADGSSEYEKVKVNQFISTLFKGGNEPNPHVFRKTGSGLSCNSGCTQTYNNRSSNLTVNSGQTICLTGTLSNNIDIKVKSGGKVKICASGSFDELKIEGTGRAYILENTTLVAKKIKVYHKDAKFYNWSDSLRATEEFLVKGYAENRGKIYTYKNTKVDEDGFMKNYGLFKVIGSGSDNDLEVEGKFYNYHFAIVGDDLKIKSGGRVKNYCLLHVDDDLENDGYLWSNCYIKVGDNYEARDGSTNIFDNGALTSTQDLINDEKIEGTGTKRSKLKVTGNSNLKSGSILKGKLDLCDTNGVETNNGSLQNGAALSCTGYLPSSTCQPEQFGTPPTSDCDNDGVPDTQDEYPCDPDRAFNSYYPSATETATLAFEDLWPATGDYDYNDLVLAFNIHKILNADNKVVDYKVKMKVLAVGAAFDNGFGWQFDELVPSDINTITGQTLVRNIITRNANNTEANQAKAVIIAYDSPEPSLNRAAGSMFNTIKTNPTGTSDTMRININFTNPVDDSKLGISKFNPFIFADQHRDAEIHLGNFKPTDLANTSMFGQWNDRSNPSQGIYYKTANGMPWAILLPTNFVYPKEYAAITSAYNFFDDWATSGGTTNTNWYTDAPGNRNIANLFGLL
jgi:LruC domain-containing protein